MGPSPKELHAATSTTTTAVEVVLVDVVVVVVVDMEMEVDSETMEQEDTEVAAVVATEEVMVVALSNRVEALEGTSLCALHASRSYLMGTMTVTCNSKRDHSRTIQHKAIRRYIFSTIRKEMHI
jgi:predicted YcjX-like family ATPase